MLFRVTVYFEARSDYRCCSLGVVHGHPGCVLVQFCDSRRTMPDLISIDLARANERRSVAPKNRVGAERGVNSAVV